MITYTALFNTGESINEMTDLLNSSPKLESAIIAPMTAGEIKGASIVPNNFSLNLFVEDIDIAQTESELEAKLGHNWNKIFVKK